MKRKPLSTAQKVRLFQDAGGICHICGGKIDNELWDVEHVIPLALGGDDAEANMRPAHRQCHAPKTVNDIRVIAKAKRLEARRIGIKKQSKWQTKFRRKMDGTVEVRK